MLGGSHFLPSTKLATPMRKVMASDTEKANQNEMSELKRAHVRWLHKLALTCSGDLGCQRNLYWSFLIWRVMAMISWVWPSKWLEAWKMAVRRFVSLP